MSWFAENAGTIVTCLVLAAVIAAVILGQVWAKRRGKTSCGCGCTTCPSAGCCAKQPKIGQSVRKHPS